MRPGMLLKQATPRYTMGIKSVFISKSSYALSQPNSQFNLNVTIQKLHVVSLKALLLWPILCVLLLMEICTFCQFCWMA